MECSADFLPGDIVMYVCNIQHDAGEDRCYPKEGTVGVISSVFPSCCLVTWPRGTVTRNPLGNSKWFCNNINLLNISNHKSKEKLAIEELFAC